MALCWVLGVISKGEKLIDGDQYVGEDKCEGVFPQGWKVNKGRLSIVCK